MAIDGTNSWPSVERTSRSTTSVKMNVATNKPRTTWFCRSARNVRNTRGDSWLEASWSTSMVTVKTRPVKVSIDWAMVERKLRAPSGVPPYR